MPKPISLKAKTSEMNSSSWSGHTHRHQVSLATHIRAGRWTDFQYGLCVLDPLFNFLLCKISCVLLVWADRQSAANTPILETLQLLTFSNRHQSIDGLSTGYIHRERKTAKSVLDLHLSISCPLLMSDGEDSGHLGATSLQTLSVVVIQQLAVDAPTVLRYTYELDLEQIKVTFPTPLALATMT